MPHFVRSALLVPLVLALLLVGATALFPSEPAHAQEDVNEPQLISVQVQSPPGEDSIPKGGSATFLVLRSGDTSGEQEVILYTREPNRFIRGVNHPNRIQHRLRFGPDDTEIKAQAAVLGSDRDYGEFIGPETLDVNVWAVGSPGETLHDPELSIPIRQATTEDVFLSITAVVGSIDEGGDPEFTLTRVGDTSSAATTTVRVEDPDDAMLGNHWDDELQSSDYRRTAIFAEGVATTSVSFHVRPNIRDTGDLVLTAFVEEGNIRNQWLGHSYSASVTVTDDDTAPEVSLSVDRSEVLEGEEVTFTLTRHGDTTQALESPPFSVRIGPTVPRRLFQVTQEAQNYGVSVEAGRSELEWVVDTHYDGADSDFTFEARFAHRDGIPEDSVGEYYRVRGERSVEASVSNRSPPVVAITGVGAGELEYRQVGGNWVLSEEFYEGQEVPFTLRRTGTVEQMNEQLEVRLGYVEKNHPDRVIENGRTISNPSAHSIYVTFQEGETQASGTFTVAVDDVDEPVSTSTLDLGELAVSRAPRAAYDTLPLTLASETGHVAFLIEDSPAQAIAIEVAGGNSTMNEGETAEFILTRLGPTDDALTVEVSIDDPGNFRRGNHWEATPPSTTSVTFAAASATATLAVATRNDLRDIPDNTLTVTIQPDTGISYRQAFEREGEYSASVTVTDDDTAPEVSLSVDRLAIDEGESLTFTLTRHGDVSHALEGMILLGVAPDSRRQLSRYVYEGGQFVRADFTAGQSSLDFEYEVRIDQENKDFRYEARVAFNNPGRTSIPDSDFSEYLIVRGDRLVGASVRNQPLQTISFASVGGVPFTDRTLKDNDVGQIFYEGQQVPFVLQRSGTEAQIDRELEVRVRYYEPYHPYVDAQVSGRTFNPSEQLIFVTFPAGETQAHSTFNVSIDDVDETLEEGVTSGQDWMVLYLYPPIYSGYSSTYRSVHTGITTAIHENPQAVSISPADDDSSVDEGETVEFLLTRHGSTSTALTLNVTIDDPGDFRRGNHWRSTPDHIVPVRFSEGSATTTLSVPTQDDWRDIPDNTVTATIPPSQDSSYRPAYEAEGESSASVTVRDNDVAPHITLSASTSTVAEGQAASFTLTRNNTENRLLVRFLFGLQGEEQFQTYTWDENKSQITVDLVTEDNDYDDPDETVYVLSLIPSADVPRDELSQYWIVEGPSSATITVTDNDLPLVWVSPIVNSFLKGSYREGAVASVRLERDGQFLRELTVNVRWFEAADPDAGDYSHRTLSDVEETFIWARIRTAAKAVPGGDGDEGDGLMGLKLLPGEGYRIDEERSSRTFTVVDADPTPVLSVSDATASEGDGTIDFKVSIESTVSPPSRREMSVWYTTSGRTAESGSDYIGTSERLLIPPLATSTIISIPLMDDALVEEEESFSLLLYRPHRAEMQDGQETLSVTGTITDDEPIRYGACTERRGR